MFANAQVHLQGSQTVGMATHGDDSGLYVEFRTEAVHQPFASSEAGRPIFKDTPYITILFPGDKTKKIDRPAKLVSDESGPSDTERFPRQWLQFEKQEAQTGDGLPVTEWPAISKSQAQELKAMNIHTVEAMAKLPDTACNWMGARDLRAQANNWLERMAGGKTEARLQSELQKRDAQIEALQKQIEDMASKFAAKEKTK